MMTVVACGQRVESVTCDQSPMTFPPLTQLLKSGSEERDERERHEHSSRERNDERRTSIEAGHRKRREFDQEKQKGEVERKIRNEIERIECKQEIVQITKEKQERATEVCRYRGH